MRISRIQIIGNAFFIVLAVITAAGLFSGTLSADPIQTATIITGRTAIYALLFSLYCTPLSRILRMSVFHRLRKITGLYGFYFALAHFLIFFILDFQGNLAWILPELQYKPFLQIGLIALFLLFPLAVSSLNALKTKMGAWWKRLHYLSYLIIFLVVIHAALASKGDLIDPAVSIILYFVAMLLRTRLLRNKRINKLPERLKKLNTFLIT